jgi:hypothetical protein
MNSIIQPNFANFLESLLVRSGYTEFAAAMRSSCDRQKATMATKLQMSPRGFNGSADKLQDKISPRQSFDF